MRNRYLLVTLLLTSLAMGVRAKKHVIHFDQKKEMSGAKVALSDIHPGLPSDWTDYR